MFFAYIQNGCIQYYIPLNVVESISKFENVLDKLALCMSTLNHLRTGQSECESIKEATIEPPCESLVFVRHLQKQVRSHHDFIVQANSECNTDVTVSGVRSLDQAFAGRHIASESVFGISDQVRHKPGCTAREDG